MTEKHTRTEKLKGIETKPGTEIETERGTGIEEGRENNERVKEKGKGAKKETEKKTGEMRGLKKDKTRKRREQNIQNQVKETEAPKIMKKRASQNILARAEMKMTEAWY